MAKELREYQKKIIDYELVECKFSRRVYCL